jgi:predicted SAM-dependent methyltransferase
MATERYSSAACTNQSSSWEGSRTFHLHAMLPWASEGFWLCMPEKRSASDHSADQLESKSAIRQRLEGVQGRALVRKIPLLGPLLAQRDDLVADRAALLQDRDALNADRNSEVGDLAYEKSVLLAKLEALERTAHQLLVLRNEPRTYLAARFLSGVGIEIGALHRPVTLPEVCSVRYVDRMSTDDLWSEYPEWEKKDLCQIDIVDDGETLVTIADESLDFIVANHFLEHCEDPIGTLLVHLRRLRPGGHLFYAIPDKRHSFDRVRPVTSVEHLANDHRDGGRASREAHFFEFAQLVQKSATPALHGQKLLEAGYSIHYHVWTSTEFLQLLVHIQNTHDARLELVALQTFGNEFIVILCKQS